MLSKRVVLPILLIGMGAAVAYVGKTGAISPDMLLSKVTSSVKGVSTQNTSTYQPPEKPKPKSLREIETKLEEIKKDMGNLNVEDITNSSPQFQKITRDIENLHDLPRNQAKEACLQVCSGL